ncbi:hypothetical protein QAD02_004009, partial [Eretmocerus hayati]
IQSLYEIIVEIWKTLENDGERNVLKGYSETGRLFTIGYMGYMLSACAVFVSMPLHPVLLDIVMPLNDSRALKSILEGEYLIDLEEYYGAIWAYECFVCAITNFLFIGVDSSYSAYVHQCVGLLAIVKFHLRSTSGNTSTKLNENNGSNDAYNSIVRPVELHRKALRFANALESTYSTNFFILFALNAVLLSVGSVVILINLDHLMEFIRYSMIWVGVMMHMFYLSLPAQKLTDISAGIFHDAYTNKWYKCTVKTQKLLKFIMMRSKEPCLLTAGKVYVMNLENCGA